MRVTHSRIIYFMKSYWKNKIFLIYLIAASALFLSVILGVSLGSTKVSIIGALSKIFSGNIESTQARIFIYVRLPRVIACIGAGAALAVSGAIIQGVLANSLASPSIIGVNAGAGLAITVSSALGIVGGLWFSLFSFLGAFLTVIAVSLGAGKWGASRGTVILIGVAVNAFLGAITDTFTTFIPELSIVTNDFKIGDFSAVTYQRVLPAFVIVIIAVIISTTVSNELDVLTLGDESARSLGLNTVLMRVVFLLLAALLAGAAVSICGLLSFVGLLVPHAVRRVSASKSKHLIPLCALFGAGFVTLCDTVARTAFAPYELPVGIIMAFLGAPFFIFILVKGKGGHRHA